MALSVTQIVAASYNAVLTKSRPANQWTENSALRALEKFGFIKRESLGPQIEVTLDYRANADGDFQSSDIASVADVTAKTDVLSAALYTPAELSYHVKWTKKDEAMNPSENQKINLTKNLLTNALNSHDDKIEQKIFAATYNGFLGLQTLVPVSGQGTVGGIDASVDTMWRNPAYSTGVGYQADGSDIDAKLTTAWNAVIKGTGSTLTPKLLLSGSTPNALFEAGLQAQQRFDSSDEAARGFKSIMFKTASWVFSPYGDSKVYMLNPEAYQLVVSKEYFRDRGETQEIEARNAFIFKIYSALQAVVANKSRLAVVDSF